MKPRTIASLDVAAIFARRQQQSAAKPAAPAPAKSAFGSAERAAAFYAARSGGASNHTV